MCEEAADVASAEALAAKDAEDAAALAARQQEVSNKLRHLELDFVGQ